MKIGDVVMFVDTGRYAQWFFGQLGRVKRFTPTAADGKAYCHIEWLQPVKYFDSEVTVSNFSADKFEE